MKKPAIFLLLSCFALLAAASSAPSLRTTMDTIAASAQQSSFAQAALDALDDLLELEVNSKTDRFFRFLPQYVGAALPGGQPLQWSTPCFASNVMTASALQDGDDEVHVSITSTSPSSASCYDWYLLLTVEGAHVHTALLSGETALKWKLASRGGAAERAGVRNLGFRIFRFQHGLKDTASSFAETAALFLPALTHRNVPAATAELNRRFLRDVVRINMTARTAGVVAVEEALVHSGDFLAVIRLDGLDPMLAMAMGSHTGHTATALRIDGQLFVVESTTKDSYWPTNGVQRTPWAQWLRQADEAGYNVLWVPLTASAKSAFNASAAVDFFLSVEGLNYGFHNMLFGWLDVPPRNMPCLPPDYSSECVPLELLEMAFPLVSALAPATAKSMWEEALNKRLQTEALTTVQLYATAAARNISFSQLLAMPEQDSWVYSDGLSMVCDVLVCRVWKAAGLFGADADSIQCAEFTNWDAYSLTFLDAAPQRPPVCVAADPDNCFCQLVGDFHMALPDVATKAPYPHMAERCPGQPPAYDKPADC